jgi:hypothetical protein
VVICSLDKCKMYVGVITPTVFFFFIHLLYYLAQRALKSVTRRRAVSYKNLLNYKFIVEKKLFLHIK